MKKNLLFRKVEDINNELNKIFDVVSDESEFSVYKSQLLYAKLHLLSDLLDKTMVTLINNTIIETKMFMFRKLLTLIAFIIALITMFINLPIGLVIVGFAGFCIHKINKEAVIKSQELIKVDEVTKIANEMVITFDNCYSFLNKKTNDKLENKPEELENEDLRKISIANYHIEFVMATGIKEEIPEDIQKVMIKMLQDTLGTNECDLEKLLELAAQKMFSEQKQIDDMTLKRLKTEENNGKRK